MLSPSFDEHNRLIARLIWLLPICVNSRSDQVHHTMTQQLYTFVCSICHLLANLKIFNILFVFNVNKFFKNFKLSYFTVCVRRHRHHSRVNQKSKLPPPNRELINWTDLLKNIIKINLFESD